MKIICTVMVAGMMVYAIAGAAGAKDAAKPEATLIYSFCSQQNCADGEEPPAGLVDVDGTLYGTTQYGGISGCTQGCGVVFSLAPATGTETVVYSFCSRQNCTDGSAPRADLLHVKNMMYGTTETGGAYGDGTVFTIDLRSGAETVLHSFGEGADGSTPMAGLIESHDILYGTTGNGGEYGHGAVYSLDPHTGSETVVYSFGGGADGQGPEAALVELNGMLYGTTYFGGDRGFGTVFALDPKTGAETVFHSFGSGVDGQYPEGGLVELNHVLFGATEEGGTSDAGTIFTIDQTTGTEQVVYSFCSKSYCADGELPDGNLIEVKGAIYGTTFAGDRHDDGTAFVFYPGTGVETVLHSFGEQYDQPVGGLLRVGNTLYGTTSEGGANVIGGAVFALTHY
jgi:uncharacterized repeat protein (TIGR03803 family)